jgi:LysR family nitrogen assimilation transcriptional regulator
MLQLLVSGQLDLALVFGDQAISGIAQDFLGKENLHLIGAEDASAVSAGRHCCARRRIPVTFDTSWSSARDKEEVERAASQGGCRLNVVMEVDSVENIKALVAAGMDYTLLSSRVARHGPNATQLGDAVRLAIPPPNGRSFWPVARSSKAPLSAAASSISESLSLCSFAGTGQKRRILRTSHLPLLESKLWRPRMEKRTAYEKRSVRSQTANYDA